MTDQATIKASFPLPPGIEMAMLNAPDSALVHFGPVMTMYVGAERIGGVYRFDAGVWLLWYPVAPPAFQAAARAWLEENGLWTDATPGTASSTPPGTAIN